MDHMRKFPDNYFDLAIVDPPYFTGPEKRRYYGNKVSSIGVKRVYQALEEWELPSEEYFQELFRISKNQIIWGINYFSNIYDFGPGRIIWDKVNGRTSFSDCEIAYCSSHDSTRQFRYMWNGMFQGKSIDQGHIQQGNKKLNENKIHPTQKPIDLYKWLLMKYAKKGYKILDTHAGSASSLIACHDLGFEYIAYEKSKKMYVKSKERLNDHTRQLSFLNVK